MAEKIFGNRYRIQSKIGIGGMATVYRGMDTVLGRPVAVKTMLPQYASDASFAARFKQEAQAAAALQSPYIVGIFDWGHDNGTYYIVMEYLKGTDLKTGIRTHGALESRKVAQIGSQICQALSVAHRHDIIHRDVKPQNIMVQPDGNIKVMDFGIARAKNSNLTQDNSVLGTAHYVSPEQTQGKKLGPTSDIYSLGVVMYEAAVGQVPFRGDDAISVALKQVNEMPKPPRSLNPAVDADLEAIILKCLEKDPANRFQSAEQLRRALTDYLAGNKVMIPSSAGATTIMPATRTVQMAQSSSSTRNTNNPNSTGVLPKSTQPNRTNPDTAKKSKKKAAIIIAIVAAAAIIVGLVAAFSSGLIETGGTQAVPNLYNMSEADARNVILNSNFFEVGSVTTNYSNFVEKGKVMSQDPNAGVFKEKGTTINMVISNGEEPIEEVKVPDLSGMTSSEADSTLRALNLVPQADTTQSDTVDAGKVAKQTPAAGTSAKEGSTVIYYISTGGGNATVPDITGYAQATAIATLERAGFKASVDNQRYSDTVEKGEVISYTPSGSQPKGTTISLTVSLGPKGTDPSDQGGTGSDDTTPSGGGSNTNAIFKRRK